MLIQCGGELIINATYKMKPSVTIEYERMEYRISFIF